VIPPPHHRYRVTIHRSGLRFAIANLGRHYPRHTLTSDSATAALLPPRPRKSRHILTRGTPPTGGILPPKPPCPAYGVTGPPHTTWCPMVPTDPLPVPHSPSGMLLLLRAIPGRPPLGEARCPPDPLPVPFGPRGPPTGSPFASLGPKGPRPHPPRGGPAGPAPPPTFRQRVRCLHYFAGLKYSPSLRSHPSRGPA